MPYQTRKVSLTFLHRVIQAKVVLNEGMKRKVALPNAVPKTPVLKKIMKNKTKLNPPKKAKLNATMTNLTIPMMKVIWAQRMKVSSRIGQNLQTQMPHTDLAKREENHNNKQVKLQMRREVFIHMTV